MAFERSPIRSLPYRVALVSLESLVPKGSDTISRGNLAAFTQLKRIGMTVVLSSNRELVTARALLRDTQLLAESPLISHQGALTTAADGMENWSALAIDPSVVAKLLPDLRDEGVGVLYHTAQGVALSPLRTQGISSWERSTGASAVIAREAGRMKVESLLDLPVGPVQIDLFGEEATLREMMGFLNSNFAEHLSAQLVLNQHLRLRKPGVDKGRAFHLILPRLGASWAETLAFGSQDSDVSSLVAAKFGVAVGEATPNAVAAADFVAENQGSEQAFADAVLQILLRGLQAR